MSECVSELFVGGPVGDRVKLAGCRGGNLAATAVVVVFDRL